MNYQRLACADTEEKNPMIIPGAPAARRTPKSARVQSLHTRAAIAVAALPLVAAFVLAGARTATAATAFTDNHVTSISDLRYPPCRGKKPGVCPNSADMQSPGRQSDGSGQVSDYYGRTPASYSTL